MRATVHRRNGRATLATCGLQFLQRCSGTTRTRPGGWASGIGTRARADCREVLTPVLVDPDLRKAPRQLPRVIPAVEPTKVCATPTEIASVRRTCRADRHIVDTDDLRLAKMSKLPRPGGRARCAPRAATARAGSRQPRRQRADRRSPTGSLRLVDPDGAAPRLSLATSAADIYQPAPLSDCSVGGCILPLSATYAAEAVCQPRVWFRLCGYLDQCDPPLVRTCVSVANGGSLSGPARGYPIGLEENGIPVGDMLWLDQDLSGSTLR